MKMRKSAFAGLMLLSFTAGVLSTLAFKSVKNNKNDIEITPSMTVIAESTLNPTVVWEDRTVPDDEKTAAEATATKGPSPTPFVTPNVSHVDTTMIVGEYMPNPDTTGLEIINQEELGDTSQITYLKGLTEKGAVIEIINGTTFVNGLLMVNKTYRLPSYYVPKNTHEEVEGKAYAWEGVTSQVWDAWEEMTEDAGELGLSLKMSSGYRSYDCQDYLFASYVMRDGQEAADTFSARAGHSEHQSGLCFDLNSVNDSFKDTAEGKWINDNCYKYGFCIRFPYGKSEYTGYKYESWHLRYVGTELAKILYNNGEWISLEEYFGLRSHYIYDYVTSAYLITSTPAPEEPSITPALAETITPVPTVTPAATATPTPARRATSTPRAATPTPAQAEDGSPEHDNNEKNM